MKILFWLRKNKINRAGLAPIYCRITIDGVRKDFTTNYFVKPDGWDSLHGRSRLDQNINSGLSLIENKLHDAFTALSRANAELTSNNVFRKMTRTDKPTVLLVKWLEKYHNSLNFTKFNTVKGKRVCYQRLVKWLNDTKRDKMLVSEVTALLGKQLDKELLAEKMKPGYLVKVYRFFHAAMDEAVLEEHVASNPLSVYKPKKGAPKDIVYLTRAEVLQIYNHSYTNVMYRKVADVFVFQCFTSLAHCDTQSLDCDKHIQTMDDGNRWIVKKRDKSGELQRIPLTPIALEILEKYNYKLPVFVNQLANRIIKEIALLLGIKKHLTCHVARRTAATLFYNSLPPRTTAAIMGHTTTNMTEKLYARLLPEVLMNDCKDLFKK